MVAAVPTATEGLFVDYSDRVVITTPVAGNIMSKSICSTRLSAQTIKLQGKNNHNKLASKINNRIQKLPSQNVKAT